MLFAIFNSKAGSYTQLYVWIQTHRQSTHNIIKIRDRSETFLMHRLVTLFIVYLLRLVCLKLVCCFEKYNFVCSQIRWTFSFHISQSSVHTIYIDISVLFFMQVKPKSCVAASWKKKFWKLTFRRERRMSIILYHCH